MKKSLWSSRAGRLQVRRVPRIRSRIHFSHSVYFSVSGRAWKGSTEICLQSLSIFSSMAIPSILDAAHAFAARGLGPGGVAIDATVGNGHDTLFLVQEVGEEGTVIGFDVQSDALQATRDRVESEAPDVSGCLHLVHAGHESMAEHVGAGVQVDTVMFNLGYLPGGDHSVITTPDTTLPALREAVDLLGVGGVVTIVAYPGHDGGAAETDAVASWVSSLPQATFRSLSYRFVNQANDPPRLFVVEKRSKPR